MPDYYLRADSKSDIEQKLIGSGLAYIACGAQGEEWISPSGGVAIDHIGPYVIQNYDENGAYNPIIKDSRWHTNIKTKFELNQAQKNYLPLIEPPETPNRIFV